MVRPTPSALHRCSCFEFGADGYPGVASSSWLDVPAWRTRTKCGLDGDFHSVRRIGRDSPHLDKGCDGAKPRMAGQSVQTCSVCARSCLGWHFIPRCTIGFAPEGPIHVLLALPTLPNPCVFLGGRHDVVGCPHVVGVGVAIQKWHGLRGPALASPLRWLFSLV